MNDVKETKHLIDQFCIMAQVVSVDDAQALVREFDRMDSLMPITDPTGYRAILRTMPGHRRVAEAFLRFRAELEQVLAEGK